MECFRIFAWTEKISSCMLIISRGMIEINVSFRVVCEAARYRNSLIAQFVCGSRYNRRSGKHLKHCIARDLIYYERVHFSARLATLPWRMSASMTCSPVGKLLSSSSYPIIGSMTKQSFENNYPYFEFKATTGSKKNNYLYKWNIYLPSKMIQLRFPMFPSQVYIVSLPFYLGTKAFLLSWKLSHFNKAYVHSPLPAIG